MAASDRIVLVTRNADIKLGSADDAVGTYSTGSLRGKVHAATIPRQWMTNPITAVGDDNTRQTKTIQDLTGGSLEWIVTEETETIAETLYKQDSSKLFPFEWSPRGTASGKKFWQYLTQFYDFTESISAEGIVVLTQTFSIESIEAEGTH